MGPRAALAALLRLLQAAGRRPLDLAVRHPVLLFLLVRVAEDAYRRLLARRQYLLGRWRVQRKTDEIDGELIQCSLLTCQELVRLGRVEKRTLFTKSMREVFGSDGDYLVPELFKGSQKCRQQSSNGMVMRWVPPDERYHILQACLNAVSSLFGSNYVHFNALGGEQTELFKSTWYCLTVVTPTASKDWGQQLQPQTPSRRRSSSSVCDRDETCTFTDMSRTPRATLRIVIANETELRMIADGKLQPPLWGFFNHRHAERYKLLRDFAANFQRQLVATPANARGAPSRNPFTSERISRADGAGMQNGSGSAVTRPDGGALKRVQSQPSMNQLSALGPDDKKGPLLRVAKKDEDFGRRNTKTLPIEQEPTVVDLDRSAAEKGTFEDNCFLRLHVPHFTGEKPSHSHSPVYHPVAGTGSSPPSLSAAPTAGHPARRPA